jgi:hypothetical protein
MGALIARHDCGDRSRPERLARQAELFNDPDCVLSGCATSYFAPGGELLYTLSPGGEDVRHSLLSDPVRTIRGLPHHGSAMFRRDAYEEAGRYRPEFYFAQDLDLWIRLAQRGRVRITKETLYEASFDAAAISSRHRQEQVESACISIAIRDSENDAASLLARAAAIRPRTKVKNVRRSDSRAAYFIASCLRRNGDPAWRGYLRQSLRRNPLQLRGWLLAVRGR